MDNRRNLEIGGHSPGGHRWWSLSPRRLSAASAHHPWRTLGAWILAIVVISVVASAFGGEFGDDDGTFTNNPEAKQGQELIDRHFGKDERASETIIIHGDLATVDDPAFVAAVQRTLDALAPYQADIAEVVNYYALQEAGEPNAELLVSQDRHTLIIPLTFTADDEKLDDKAEAYMATVEAASGNEFAVYTVGDLSADAVYGNISDEDMSKDFRIGLPVSAVVLVVVFGALVAALLPMLLGIVAIVTATALAALLATMTSIASATEVMISMIGLAVGIDYALFFIERFREERRHGALPVVAIEHAGATAGKAVMFSGGTVLLALLGLLLLPVDVFHGLGLGAVLAVLVSVIAAVTLLPALLRLLGDWINIPRFGLIRRLRAQESSALPPASYPAPEESQRGLWGRVARMVMRRPVVALVVSTAILLAAALPALDLRTGEPDFEALPETRLKTGYRILAREFYAGLNEPVKIVVAGDAGSPAVRNGVAALTAALADDAAYGPAFVETSADGQLTVISAPVKADPYAVEATEAITRLRETVVPEVFGAETEVYVTGATAFTVDFNEILASHAPRVFAFVLGLSFVLLTLAFRSLVVPVKAILLNLLSVGAAYGLTVAVFQKGWGADLLGFTQVEVITNWLPIFLFCILFGLSMDYHVFLLSRIREHYDLTGDNDEAVAVGLQSTGRIITGAALIMVAVFGVFAMGRLTDVQQLGFGLAVAVLLDATLVRCVLVPATMKLLGRTNWYLPRALHWLPDLRVEGTVTPTRIATSPTSGD